MSGRGFSDLPDDARMAFRYALDTIGAEVNGYHGDFVAVGVARVEGSTWAGIQACDRIAKDHGLTRDDDGWYFPLGSDQLPERLRHAMPWKYGPALSFRFSLNYRPVSS